MKGGEMLINAIDNLTLQSADKKSKIKECSDFNISGFEALLNALLAQTVDSPGNTASGDGMQDFLANASQLCNIRNIIEFMDMSKNAGTLGNLSQSKAPAFGKELQQIIENGLDANDFLQNIYLNLDNKGSPLDIDTINMLNALLTGKTSSESIKAVDAGMPIAKASAAYDRLAGALRENAETSGKDAPAAKADGLKETSAPADISKESGAADLAAKNLAYPDIKDLDNEGAFSEIKAANKNDSISAGENTSGEAAADFKEAAQKISSMLLGKVDETASYRGQKSSNADNENSHAYAAKDDIKNSTLASAQGYKKDGEHSALETKIIEMLTSLDKIKGLAGKEAELKGDGASEKAIKQLNSAGGLKKVALEDTGFEKDGDLQGQNLFADSINNIKMQSDRFKNVEANLDRASYSRDSILEQIYDRIKVISKDDFSELRLNLKPDELGEVAIKLVMDKGNLAARITVDNSYVKDLIESNIPKIRENLKDQNVDVSSFNVSVGGNQENFLNDRNYSGNAYVPGRGPTFLKSNKIGGSEIFEHSANSSVGLNLLV
jgi:flagellar hook-length control protein FliK